MMRTFLLGLCFAVMSGTSNGQMVSQPLATSAVNETRPPEHPATVDQIREYMSLVRMDKTAHETLDTTAKAMQTTSAPYYPASFWTDIRAEFLKLDVTAAYVPIYQKYLSEEDMTGVIAFYRSPAGKRLLDLQPVLVREAQAVMRAKGEAIGVAVYAKHKDEIEAAKKTYEAEHPAPAAK